MRDDQREFIDFLVRADVLTFGDFVTKSGRATPYFFDAGRIRTGPQLARFGAAYARTIDATFGADVDVLFGPAYKGIPIAVTTAVALAQHHTREVAICFDRKEAKDHGEGGVLVGHRLRDGDRVVIVEDVTTAGTSIRRSIPLLRGAADVDVVGLVVAVDRAERGAAGDRSALQELAEEFGLRTAAIVSIDDVVEHLRDHEVDGQQVLGHGDLDRIAAYRARYGASG